MNASQFPQRSRGALRAAAVGAFLVTGCAAPRALWLGGDVHFGADTGDRLTAVSAAMAPAVGVVNLEGPIGPDDDARAASAEKLINGPRAAEALAQAGIVAAGIANNHAGDGDVTATRAALSAAGVQSLGGAVVLLQGLKVALTAHDLTAGVPAGLAEELKAARAKGDLLVATFHVTGPASFLPRSELEEAVAIALDAGATVVAAHGTHVVARVERRGEAVIAWGLGNLAFTCPCTDETDGLVLRVELDAHGRVTRAEAIPVDAGLNGRPATPAHDPQLLLELLESLQSSPGERHGDRLRF